MPLLPLPLKQWLCSGGMRQRAERHAERMAGVSERAVDHIERMDGPRILRSIDEIEKSTKLRVARLGSMTFNLGHISRSTSYASTAPCVRKNGSARIRWGRDPCNHLQSADAISAPDAGGVNAGSFSMAARNVAISWWV